VENSETLGQKIEFIVRNWPNLQTQ